MHKPLTTIIIDDEQDSIQMLKKLLGNFQDRVELIAECKNAQHGLESIMDANPDVVFLDIQMPGKDGFWLADKIHSLRKRPYIIFVTAYDEYALEAIKHSAFDFLTKPVNPEELEKAIQRVEEGVVEKKYDKQFSDLKDFLSKKKLRLNTNNGFILISQEDIVYCEASGNYSYMNMINGQKELVCMQLGEIEEKIDSEFVRISRSFIINSDMIEKVNRKNKCVYLNDGIQKYELKASTSGIKKLYKVDY